MYAHDFDVWNGPESNVNLSIESPYVASYLMEIVMFPISVINCQLIMCELPNVLDLNLSPSKSPGHEVQRHQLRHWMEICMTYNLMKEMANQSHFCVVAERGIHTHIHTHTHAFIR